MFHRIDDPKDYPPDKSRESRVSDGMAENASPLWKFWGSAGQREQDELPAERGVPRAGARKSSGGEQHAA
jgi:hypothetical protein